MLFLILSWQNGRGLLAGPVHHLGILCFVLAVFAAAAGHWLQLDQLRLGRWGGVLRVITQVLIGFCLLMLVLMVSGMGLVVVLGLLYGTVAALGLSLLVHLLAALGTVAGGGREAAGTLSHGSPCEAAQKSAEWALSKSIDVILFGTGNGLRTGQLIR